ncbi:hypothetical protein EJ110_NYTH14149 [Nymphaea thermarum]|nr:hypothetical protein EJ110_NYTH14149 [Nymphaea thermarum]
MTVSLVRIVTRAQGLVIAPVPREVKVKEPSKKAETPKAEDKPEEVESCHSLTDPYKSNVVRVFGRLNGHKVLTLLDSGATNNFLAVEAAARCKAVVQPSKTQTVIVGDGHHLKSVREGKDIEVVIKKKTFKIDLILVPLDGVDLKLGMPWFFTLGIINWDAKNFRMTFTPDGSIRLYSVRGNILYRKNRAVVPPESELKRELL